MNNLISDRLRKAVDMVGARIWVKETFMGSGASKRPAYKIGIRYKYIRRIFVFSAKFIEACAVADIVELKMLDVLQDMVENYDVCYAKAKKECELI